MTRSAIDGATGVNSNSFYDCKSGVSISVILALTLAWIPYIGPIVAGFIGGRRAGSILRGLFAGVLSSVIVFGVAFLLGLGLVKLFEPEYQSFIDALEGFAPFIVDGLREVMSYLSDNFVSVTTDISISLVPQTYASIISFAIIGGVFADQARKELRIIVSQSMNANKPRPRRSTVAFLEGRDRGFQTYGDLSRMTVSEVSASIEAEELDDDQDAVPVQNVPEPVDMGLVTSGAVTVEPSVPAEDAAMVEDVPVEEEKQVAEDPVPEERKQAPEKPNASDDLEWL